MQLQHTWTQSPALLMTNGSMQPLQQAAEQGLGYYEGTMHMQPLPWGPQFGISIFVMTLNSHSPLQLSFAFICAIVNRSHPGVTSAAAADPPATSAALAAAVGGSSTMQSPQGVES